MLYISNPTVDPSGLHRLLMHASYRVSPKKGKGYPLKSSANAVCSNLKAFNFLMSPRMREASEQRIFMLALHINWNLFR